MEKEKEAEMERDTLLSRGKSKFLKNAAKALQMLPRKWGSVSKAFWEVFPHHFASREATLKGNVLMAGSILGVFLFALVVSLACFPLDVYPAGYALIGALGGTVRLHSEHVKRKNILLLESVFLLAAVTGVLSSCFFVKQNGFFYMIGYLILFLIRTGITGGKFHDSILTRLTLSAGVSTAMSLFLAFLSDFTVSRVFASVSSGLLTPILCYLLCGVSVYTSFLSEGTLIHQKRRLDLEAAVFTLLYLFLYALRRVTVLGFSLSFLLAVIATLSFSRAKGALFGAAAGMIGGMACVSSAIAPSLAVGGFFSGLFFEYSELFALMVSFVASCGYSLISEGFSSFALITSDYLCAVMLFFPFLRFFPRQKGEMGQKTGAVDVFHRETVRHTRQKLKNMSEAFSSLSEVFYTVGDTLKKPGITEVSRMVSECCSQVCSRCMLSEICWGENQVLSADVTAKVAAKLLAGGRLRKEDFTDPLSEKCNRLNELLEKINRRFDELNGGLGKNNQTALLAGEYSTVSRLLKNTAGELNRELEYNGELESRAANVLKELGILYRRVAVFGNREIKIDVYGVAMERVSIASDDITEAFGREFECVFDAPGFFMMEENVIMRLKRKRSISLECAKSGCAKKGESVSGDSCLFFETDRDYFYTLICDGMGSGREAAFASRLASIFIEKLMRCASPKNVTLEMLNTFLMAKNDETFTTVDLLEIDLLSSSAHFIKAGAAPSYVLRGDRLHRIESRTPPAGVLSRMCAEQTAFSLLPGDFIIQMSDGAEDSEEGSGWLVRLLAGEVWENAASLCDSIFRAAREKGSFRDDLSVSVVRIMNAR